VAVRVEFLPLRVDLADGEFLEDGASWRAVSSTPSLKDSIEVFSTVSAASRLSFTARRAEAKPSTP
jgi:hypothetical protein